jgi:hypothetical protein
MSGCREVSSARAFVQSAKVRVGTLALAHRANRALTLGNRAKQKLRYEPKYFEAPPKSVARLSPFETPLAARLWRGFAFDLKSEAGGTWRR